MDIKDIKAKKKELESDILAIVGNRLEKFKKETGISPTYIALFMNCVETIGGEKEFFLSSVRADVSL